MQSNQTSNLIKNILITGNPGVGKTTLIQRIISKLEVSAGGFYTSEVRSENGKRWGFKIVSLDGQEGVLASVDIVSQRKVSKYGVDVSVMDRVGTTAVQDAIQNSAIIVIDEIGRMELTSNQFRNAVLKALDSPKVVLGTVPIKPTNFTDKIKKREYTKIIRLTRANFSEVETHIERLLHKILNKPLDNNS
jgi:nucleoside-triphosphatase